MIDDSQRDYLKSCASETLDVFEAIANNARNCLPRISGSSLNSLASVNAFTMENAARKLETIDRTQQEAYERLAREPSIARVIAADEEGNRETYYISRGAPPAPFLPGVKFGSYRSPAGRLASLPPGETVDLRRPSGNVVLEVIERALFHPQELQDGWDSTDTLFQTEAFGPVTVDSLRKLLLEAGVGEDLEDALGMLLAEEQARNSVVETRRRGMLEKMGLRDQPVLDQFQDEIFRLSIDTRAVLLGPPGSGKTTTLIKRLGQKLDLQAIEQDEPDDYALLKRMEADGGQNTETSWLMFTPTELLRAYVKEAFAKENIAASDQRIRTWVTHRRDLARDAFQLLRTAGEGGGFFILREDEPTLLPTAISDGIGWFSDFDAWQNVRFWADLNDAAAQLVANKDPAVAAMGNRLAAIVGSGRDEPAVAALLRLAGLAPDVRTLLEQARQESEGRLRKALNLQINRDKAFLSELGSHLEQLGEPNSDEADEEDGDVEEEEEETPRTQLPTMRVANAYLRALRAQARAAASGRRPRGRPAAILSWLGDRGLSDADALPVGNALLLQRALARFSNPIRLYLRALPQRYRSFRQARRDEGRWYSPQRAGRYANGLEIDLMLLVSLRLSSALLQTPQGRRAAENPALSILERTSSLLRHQIFVDEATDFSAVQLACMAALAHPLAKSFFACGDFNQRITAWGVPDVEQLRWVMPDIEIRKIVISYRQTRQLLEFARALALASGSEPVLATLPSHVDNEGVSPVLATGLDDVPSTVRWLAQRIAEIALAVSPSPLPTIAILVNEEALVRPVAEALDRQLEEHNLRAVACTEGRIIGQANEVRVFDVQHIKGLEFEAVFFLAIDKLAQDNPLFARFLYVGATRAATYLGLTCEGALPDDLARLDLRFDDRWV